MMFPFGVIAGGAALLIVGYYLAAAMLIGIGIVCVVICDKELKEVVELAKVGDT